MFKYIKKQSFLVGLGIILCLGKVFINCSVNKNMTTDKEVMADNTIDSSVYDKVIREIKQKHILPDSDTEIAWENNLSIHYAMEDVNQDGVMELFIKLDYSSGPDGGILLYRYDEENNMSVHQIGNFGGSCRFYDNGIVEEEVSHGSPYGGPYNDMDHTDTFWPYQVWHYQMDEKSYKRMGFVTDWNKKEWSDSVGKYSAFPVDVDKDNDGIIYFLRYADGEENAIDYIDLEKWRNSYLKDAKEILINYQIIK